MEYSWREDNRQRWVGIRPAHNGVQVVSIASASNNVQILYTVPAGKVLYLVTDYLESYLTVAGRSSILYITNSLDVLWYYLILHMTPNSGSFYDRITRFHPLEVPEGYKIKCSTDIVGNGNNGGIEGWVE